MNVFEKCNTSSIDFIDLTTGTKDSVLTEMNPNSPFTILESPSPQNETPVPNTPANFKDENNEIRQDICRSVTTPRRNSVKRNLNKSFGDTNNYSIVEPDDDEHLFKIKLRKSRSCRIETSEKVSNVRKSMRNVPRKSYAEYVSPLKSNKQPVDGVYSPKFSERASKVVRSLDMSPEATGNVVSFWILFVSHGRL